jgi:hypothetical protein
MLYALLHKVCTHFLSQPTPTPTLSLSHLADIFPVVGWSNAVSEPAFGASSVGGDASIKSKLINLMTSVRTLMRSMFFLPPHLAGSFALFSIIFITSN